MKLSARNQIAACVTGTTEGPATTTVALDVAGQRRVASITTEAARELGLAEGSEVVAIIKASDVILATAD
jgi:molybdopterin-binding protein